MQVVARMPQGLDFHVLPVSDVLGIAPRELHRHLLVEEGVEVGAGTPIVGKRGLFGKAYVSPVDGTVHRVGNGRVVLQRNAGWFELRAMMTGRVVRLIPRRGVVLEAEGAFIQAAWSSGKDGFGELKMLADRPDSMLTAEMLGDEARGKVLAVGNIDSSEILRQLAELDAQGIILGSTSAAICQICRSLPFPVILTDGVGNQRMARPVFDLLQESEGRQASLFGQKETSSVSRPEIIITHSATPGVDPPPAQVPIRIGQTVRILRAPFSGRVAEVVRIYTYAQTTNIGTKAHGADVRFADGHVVFVPFANLDIMII